MRAAEWSGGVGETWAREWQRTDRSFAGLEDSLRQAILAAAGGADRLVDLGCGAGTTSLGIAAALPDRGVIGLDLSGDLIAVAEARRLEARAGTCRFLAGDAIAEVAALAPVDLFFSRHGVMFFDDPLGAFTSFAAAAAPDARLVFSCFTAPADNPWATDTVAAVTADDAQPLPSPAPAAPGPFAFADPARVAAILADSGWAAGSPQRVEFPYVAGVGEDPVADALVFFGGIGPAAAALRNASEAMRPALLDRLAEVCRRRCNGGEVAFPASAWLWSATRQGSGR
ncbi:class I SAM-dependent methyltransferase [Sphingomonas bacterium]|uniref:class I SAM-dependent methyltransferase n=1 Tax=Sphingomonas bacterium TaxID=1895847 RepID=UPI0015769E23|nr:class I SAM-dependent methyltransferase [Sphingomonas bacterium]